MTHDANEKASGGKLTLLGLEERLPRSEEATTAGERRRKKMMASCEENGP